MTPVIPALVAAAMLVAAADPHPRDIDPTAASPVIEDPANTLQTPTAEPEISVGPPPPAEVATATPPPVDLPASRCWEPRSQCRTLSITGIVAGALGIAAVGVGAGLMARPDKELPNMPAFQESTRPVGVVALGMGIGVVVTSMLMILAGRRAHKLGLDPGQPPPRETGL